MKIPRYWASVVVNLAFWSGRVQRSKFFGYSNVSLDDAKRQAYERANSAQKRIEGNAEAARNDYESIIREPIVEELGEKSIVTRNYYGAEVLNTTELFIVDVDQINPSIWRWLFSAKYRKQTRKQRMLTFLETKLRQLNINAYRIYETAKGFRLFIFNCSELFEEQRQIMRALNADYLYQALCERQKCFRARLTPKPFRMLDCPKIKLKYPETDASIVEQWVAQYNACRIHYATCKFVAQKGEVPNALVSLIKYHDQRTGVYAELKLA